MPDITGELKKGLLAQIFHYWHIVLKWKWTVSLFFVAALTFSVVFSLTLTPIYTAHGSLWIEGESNILPFEEVQAFGSSQNMSSHSRLLRSRTLASDTIEKLKLYENPDFVGRPRKGETLPDPANLAFREALIQKFLGSVNVAADARTPLVDVSFASHHPKLAADILNAMFECYMDMIVRKRYAASELASEFLNTQIAELRSEIEKREAELNKYGSEKDILPLTDSEAPTVAAIGDINKKLTEATIDRVNKLSYYRQLKASPLGEIPEVPEGSLLQRLREEYISLGRQYASRLATIRPEYPEMQRMKSDLDAATAALMNETQILVRNAYADYEAALRREQAIQKLLEDKKDAAYKSNSDSVVYNSLWIELENRKSLLDALSKRQSETDVSAQLKGLEAMNVWIVDRADYPLGPSFPNKRNNVLLGFLFGLAGGIGLALALEYLNHTVKTSEDVTRAIGIPTLGFIPSFEADSKPKGPIKEFAKIFAMLRGENEIRYKRTRHKGRARAAGLSELRWSKNGSARANATSIELITVREPRSIQAESYRSIRTTLLVSSPPGRTKTFLFTSPLPREGKSTTVSNLGISLAEGNKRVVIIDADLRKPKQAQIFRAAHGKNQDLSHYLSAQAVEADIVQPTEIANLHLIVCGPLPPNPVELLSSDRMDILVAYLRRNYDFVLFDSPPLLAVSDAVALAPVSDAIILVARAGHTPVPALKQAKQKLDAHKLKCYGVILNGVDLLEQDGYYAKQYYHYSTAE